MNLAVNNPNLSDEEAERLFLQPRDLIAVDIETVSLDNLLVLGIAVAVDGELGYYFFNTRHEWLYKVFEQTPKIIFHNASFDVPALRRLGYVIHDYEDTMMLAYSSGITRDKGLKALSENILHAPYTAVTEQWKKKDQGNIAIDHKIMAGWSIQHALNTYNLWTYLPKTPLYTMIDRPCVDLVIEMEQEGLLIDQHKLTIVETESVIRANKLETEIKEELGDINLGSNPQVAQALQDKGILGTRKTKARKDSVSEESLKPLNNPLTDKILKYRSVMKTLSTYVPALRKVDSQGRVHTNYGYTETGRWNSSRPNLQNLTRDDKFENE